MTAVEMLELLASLVLPGRGLENNGFDLNYQPFDEKTAEHPFWINPEQIEIARKQGFYYDLELYPDNREACFNFYYGSAEAMVAHLPAVQDAVKVLYPGQMAPRGGRNKIY